MARSFKTFPLAAAILLWSIANAIAASNSASAVSTKEAMDVLTGKRKTSSKLNRKTSTKLKVAGDVTISSQDSSTQAPITKSTKAPQRAIPTLELGTTKEGRSNDGKREGLNSSSTKSPYGKGKKKSTKASKSKGKKKSTKAPKGSKGMTSESSGVPNLVTSGSFSTSPASQTILSVITALITFLFFSI